MGQQNSKDFFNNEMTEIHRSSHWISLEKTKKIVWFRRTGRIAIIVAVAVVIMIFTMFMKNNNKVENGGTYINNQYGFSITFPSEWSGKFIIEETFDRVSVRSKKIALFCGDNYGLLFELYIEPTLGRGTLIGSLDGFSVSYEIAKNADLGNANEELQEEYYALLKSLPAAISGDAFGVIDVRVPNEIFECFTEQKVQKMFALSSSLDHECVRKLCKLLPFGKLLDECTLDEGTKTLRLTYPSKAISTYNGLLVGDIIKITATSLFALYGDIENIVVDFDLDNMIGYSRQKMSIESLSKAKSDLNATEFCNIICTPSARGRIRGFGSVEEQAVVKNTARVFTEPNESSEVKYFLDAMSPVAVKAAGGDYYYIEWHCTDNYSSQGYILCDELSFAQEDVANSSYGYCKSSILYGDDGTTVLDNAFHDWFKILEEHGNMLIIEDPSGRRGLLPKSSVIHGVPPWSVELTLAELEHIYAMGIGQAYSTDISLNNGVSSILLNQEFGIELTDDLRKKLLDDVTEQTGTKTKWYSQREKDSLYFMLDDNKSEYTGEAILLRITKQRGDNAMSVDTLMVCLQDNWSVSRTVIVEAQ